ncbi:MAG: HAD-IA family hydrolase [Emcibacteraceae bacterium]|nr:HAD-IA family hydrolase [Emcibacteraceae bacterium]
MFKKPPSAILFDLDGTIADTALDLSATLNHILKENGRATIDNTLIRNMVGQGAKALILEGFKHTGATPDDNELEKLFHEYLEYYLNHISDETVVFSGTLKLLDRLKSMNIPLAICTNKNKELTTALLKDLNIEYFFDAVTCGDSFDYKKPDPRHLYSTCDLMSVNAQDAIMVGDSINDIAAGNSADMLTVGVTFGYTETPMSELGADIVINHFDEFIDAVKKRLS